MTDSTSDIHSYSTSDLSKLIPEYDGNQTLLNNFLNACNEALQLASEHQKRLIIIHIKNKLRGRASNLINSRHIEEFEDISTLLKAHFGDSRDITSLIHDLQLLKQLPNEKASSFAHRVQSHCDQLRGTILLQSQISTAQKQAQTDLIDNMTLDVLITGLEPKIGTIVRASNPNSIITATQRIVREEQLLYYERSKVPDKYSSNFSQRRPPNKPASHSSSNHTQLCRYCKKPGHSIDDCRKRQYNNSHRNSSNFHRSNNAYQGHSNSTSHQSYQNNHSSHNNSFNRNPDQNYTNNRTQNNYGNYPKRQVNHLNFNESRASGTSTHDLKKPNPTISPNHDSNQVDLVADSFSQLQF